MLAFFFWTIAALALYSYLIYPLFLWILVKLRDKPKDVIICALPQRISLIITAYNESARIQEKIESSLALRHEHVDLEIIVASDCSDDDTDTLVKSYAEQGIVLVRAEQRLGKEYAQSCAIKIAKGEILIFSDVATHIPQGAITKLLNYFCDNTVGAVSSEDRFISQDGVLVGEGAYIKYEMWLRRQETKLAGLIGLSGSFFAVRRELCQEWDIYSPSDFNSALNVAKAGKKAVTAPDVNGFYQDLKNPSQEYQRKVRTVIRGMTGLSRHTEVLNVQQYGYFAFQLISHKLFRWLTPWFLMGLLIVNAMLANEDILYFLLFVIQLAFYGCALMAKFLPNLKKISFIRIIYFFVFANVAVFEASVRFLSGERMTTWKPSAR